MKGKRFGITLDIDGDLNELMRDKAKRMGIATTAAMKYASQTIKNKWRAQISGAGLGSGVANSVQTKDYPGTGYSYSPAALVYAKASQIIDAFDKGATITARNAVWLAIPTAEAGRGKGNARITPSAWQQSNGRRLRFVPPTGRRHALLVADDTRLNARGLARAKGGRRRKDGILSGAQTTVIFILLSQAKLPKRLNLQNDVDAVGAMLPMAIISRWRD